MELAKKELATQESHKEREIGWVLRHGRGTAELALGLRRAILPGREELDDALYAAALFHDCGKYAQRKGDHGEIGAARAHELLAGLMSKDELETVCHAILVHNRRKQAPCTELEYILQDADILDHMGSVGVWLSVAYTVKTGGTAADMLAYHRSEEYERDTEHLRSLLNYSQSTIAFHEKETFTAAFIDRFEQECAGSMDYRVNC